ncbi:PREDICTED: uncharacterized protein LOC109467181 [Branchiostoma belcheri]|uniref:Uncharacterized protein LOC109467181 n=1 Tax=Branchiostoma belcheri TaxID=7741 RepID=A0A6P4Y8B6_BRABE|nr:PREDICTED: uncharacterized protein LOC109467181 [Branchiostoma belcheri]
MTKGTMWDKTPLCVMLVVLAVVLSVEGTGIGGSMAKEFDSRCNMPNNRTQNDNQWPFVMFFQSPFIEPQGKHITGRPGGNTLKYSKVVLHENCGATIYIMAVSAYINTLWPAGITPTFDWSCTVQRTTNTTFPTVNVIFNSTIADMKTYPDIKKEWYTEGKGTDRRILIIINVANLDTSHGVILDWVCQAEVKGGPAALSIENAHFIFYPIGCPKGKYGGECEHDCKCPPIAACHTFTGACKCPPGWKGDCEIKPSGGSKAATVVLSVLLVLMVVAGLAWCWRRNTRMARYRTLEDL